MIKMNMNLEKGRIKIIDYFVSKLKNTWCMYLAITFFTVSISIVPVKKKKKWSNIKSSIARRLPSPPFPSNPPINPAIFLSQRILPKFIACTYIYIFKLE